ncbi:hypothetical protein [Streptomyces sp. WG7]|uniref:hypothetical protein n=1 Tax=Streptomyces sp. WG7 TaxID=3417650 RepID=UPI003CF03E84
MLLVLRSFFFGDVLETEGPGNRSCPAGGVRSAGVDPPPDVDRVRESTPAPNFA